MITNCLVLRKFTNDAKETPTDYKAADYIPYFRISHSKHLIPETNIMEQTNSK